MRAVFAGRLNRSSYIAGSVLWIAVMCIWVMLVNYTFPQDGSPAQLAGYSEPVMRGFFLIGYVYLLFILIRLVVRRLHDINLGAPIGLLLILVPVANIIVSLKLIFERGKSETNQFGKPPQKTLDLLGVFKAS